MLCWIYHAQTFHLVLVYVFSRTWTGHHTSAVPWGGVLNRTHTAVIHGCAFLLRYMTSEVVGACNLVPRALRVRSSRRATRRALGTRLWSLGFICNFITARITRLLAIFDTFSEFVPIFFTRKRTKYEDTRCPPFSYDTKMAAEGY